MKTKAIFSRVLTIAVAVLMMISTISVFADSVADGDWVYDRTAGNSEYYIKSYTGNSDRVKIPALFQTKPITKINSNAFLNNVVLSYVEIPATVKEIGAQAFYGCRTLSEVKLLGNIEVIGAHAFYGCTLLKTVDMGKITGLKTIPRNCFSGCLNIKTFEVPEGVESIGDRAFFDCVSLESIIIPASVSAISDLAFKNCTDLTIYGYADSYAQQFAAKNDIPFVLVGGEYDPTEPDVIPTPTKPTTATEPATAPTNSESEPSQTATDSTEPSQSTTATDSKEPSSEDNLPSNPMNTAPDFDPFESLPSDLLPTDTSESNPDESTVPGTGTQNKKKYLIGDTDLSGVVTIKDATLIQKYAASLVQLDKVQLFLANCNGTGDVNVKDATQVQKYCADFLNILFVGQEVEI